MLSILTELENIQFAGAAEAFRMWVCKLVMFIQILREIDGLHQMEGAKKCNCTPCTSGSATPDE